MQPGRSARHPYPTLASRTSPIAIDQRSFVPVIAKASPISGERRLEYKAAAEVPAAARVSCLVAPSAAASPKLDTTAVPVRGLRSRYCRAVTIWSGLSAQFSQHIRIGEFEKVSYVWIAAAGLPAAPRHF